MEERQYNSITYGQISEQKMFDILANELRTHENCEITIGTDSQNHDGRMKIVTVVCLHRIGRGGIFFYSSSNGKAIKDIRYKIYEETAKSLDLGKRLTEFLYSEGLDMNVIIHADIGTNRSGKTYPMISEIVGWVNSEGFNCYIKPDSYAASTVADKISK